MHDGPCFFLKPKQTSLEPTSYHLNYSSTSREKLAEIIIISWLWVEADLYGMKILLVPWIV
jgi:hypothetical protein